jgi:hypothetical protein
MPTCASAGLPVDYVMLRGIFMPPGVTPDQVDFYLDLFKKVRALPEWKDFMDKGAFNQTALTGQAFFDWLGKNEQMHRVLMKEAGFLAQVRSLHPHHFRRAHELMATSPEADGAGVVSVRWPEWRCRPAAAVALLVIADSLRVGIGWADDGPRSGYFPFYIGLLLLGPAAGRWAEQLLRWRRTTHRSSPSARSWPGAGRCCADGVYVAPSSAWASTSRRCC